MSDDLELADLLGEAPPSAADPSFRFDVLSRVAERRRRRAAQGRALNQVAAFVALGAVFPVLQAAGLNWADAQPMLMAAAALAVAGAVALLTIQGPAVVLARSRALLRAPLLRA